MRNDQVIKEFVDGCEKSLHTETVSIDGDRLFSYATCIAQRVKDGIVVNGTKYSVTTSKHQSYLRNAISRSGVASVEIDGILRGCSRLVG